MEEITIRSLRDSQKDKLQKTEEFMEQKPAEPLPGLPAAGRKKNLPLSFARFLALSLFIFLLGGLGGLWLDRIFLPTLLVEYPELQRYDYLKRVSDRTTIVSETKQVLISQEEDISQLIEKVGASLVEVAVKNAEGRFEKTGSGIVLTSDGYVLTPLKNLTVKEAVSKDIRITLKSGKTYEAQLAAQDADYSLAIVKIAENNLSVTPYAESADLKLGQKLVVVNDAIATDIVSRFVDDYKATAAVGSTLQKRIQLTQNLNAAFAGAAVINLEGKLVGVFQGDNLIIPLGEIRGFIDRSVSAK